MRSDLGRARLATAVVAFLVTAVIGGIAAAILTSGFRARVEEAARRDALVIGASVAQTLAQQFEKAERFGIPLKLLPGVEAHLAATLAASPSISRIVLRAPDGREIRSASSERPGIDTTKAPVKVNGHAVAIVDVSTNPAALAAALGDLRVKSAVAVVIFSLLAALVASFTVGLALDRQAERLVVALRRTAAGDYGPDVGTGRASRAAGAVGRAFRALTQGNRHVRERRAVFEAYAEELLAVDFDGSIRPDVERLRKEVLSPPPALGGAGNGPDKARGL